MESTEYYTVKEFARINKENGTWPSSEAAIWALRANSPENGFGKAFVKIGGRLLIDAKAFMECMEKQKKY